MKYRVELKFIEPYTVDVEADNMVKARWKAIDVACQETGRTGKEWVHSNCEVEIENVEELGE